MTTALIIGLFITTIAAAVFAVMVWNRSQAVRTSNAIAQMELRKLQKKAKAKSSRVDLELATTAQIIEELRNRPNNQFLLLIPHQQNEDIFVETHICNIAPQAVLIMLKIAYDGVSDAWEEEDNNGEQ